MPVILSAAVLCAVIATGAGLSPAGESAAPADPYGVLRKPIPDKLVVLTFDDGPLSCYTVVAPILKKHGFGGSFYVCDFDSFRTRKDWYLTWRQMKAMADDGLEIGNHSRGHGPGFDQMMDMEDALLANGVPKPTTIAWPLHMVNMRSAPEFAAAGYTFARDGHFRSYRPTVDNPFDIPCLGAATMEEFIRSVRQAVAGRIAVLIYHGVPDREHPPVSLAPEVFEAQMQYLKDNDYRVIALRDLAEYIDPVKAAKLPPTVADFKESGPVAMAGEKKPYVKIDVSPGKAGTVTAGRPEPCKANYLEAFDLPGVASVAMAGNRIGIYVPATTDVTRLAPAFTLPPSARAVPAPGTALDFSRPQTYTVTAQDGSSQAYTAQVFKVSQPNAFAWERHEGGLWSDGSKWSNSFAAGSAPARAGGSDCILSFSPAACVVSNDLGEGFRLNQLLLPAGAAGLTLEGNSLAFTRSDTSGILPAIRAAKCQRVRINVPLQLQNDLNVTTALDRDPNCYILLNGTISGPGALILNSSSDPDVPRSNFHDVHFGILEINGVNTYAGGTTVNGGRIIVAKAGGLGAGPVTLNNFGRLTSGQALTNPLTINSGTLFDCAWGGSIALNCKASFIGNCDIRGGMSGPGGFAMLGINGTYLNIVPGGTVTLHGTNTYAGPTTVFPGTLVVKKAAGLYNADVARWTPANITVHKAATLRLSVGGPGEFTGRHVDALLKNLTTGVNSNGLMEGCFFHIDTANATGKVVLAGNFQDSKGPGGGAFVLRFGGGGTLQLTGRSTYTGQTILEGGTLIVESFNSVVNGRPAGSLGAPPSLEAGIIGLGGDCTLAYTGRGEVTDRILNLAGAQQTVTLDQSGGGLLKFASSLDISGYGHSKTLVLAGSGTGELAGNIVDPYDRKKAATLAVTKTGPGTWVFSGTNSYTGSTTVGQGTLSLASANSLGTNTEVSVAEGATLNLSFKGEARVRKLVLGGKVQPAGTYSAATTSGFIKGAGVLRN